MADKISSYGRNNVDLTSAKARGSARNERAAESDKAESGKRPDKGSETSRTASSTASQVQLTDTATNLKQVEARIAKMPDVDRARVDAIRERVESGAYKVNAGRLADRLLAFERDLA